MERRQQQGKDGKSVGAGIWSGNLGESVYMVCVTNTFWMDECMSEWTSGNTEVGMLDF